MKNKFTENLGWKLLSLLSAVFLWMIVNNLDDPTIPQTFYNIPVRLLNTEMITDSGQVYEFLEGTDEIERVTIRAPRSVISGLNENNIIATADVSQLSSLDTITIKLSTNVYNNELESIKGSIDTVKLNIENKKTKTLALKATVSGGVDKGYLVGEITPEENLVRLAGPESVIDKVAKAAVDVDVTGFTSDIGTSVEVKLYDKENRQIHDTRISQNIKTVGVKVNIYQTMEVPVFYSYSGVPAQGYRASGEITASVETVTIAGKQSVLRNVTGIELPAESVDITDASENLITEVDIRNYLPDNVFLADQAQAKVEVTVFIQPEVSKRLKVNPENVEVINVPEGYRATLGELEENTEIEVIGLSSDVSGLREAELKGTVDIVEWMEAESMAEPVDGYYQVEIDFGLPQNVTVLEPVMVVMHLSKIQETEN